MIFFLKDNESSISKQIAPLRSPEHDLVIDEFKKHFATEDHHSDSEKTISEVSINFFTYSLLIYEKLFNYLFDKLIYAMIY